MDVFLFITIIIALIISLIGNYFLNKSTYRNKQSYFGLNDLCHKYGLINYSILNNFNKKNNIIGQIIFTLLVYINNYCFLFYSFFLWKDVNYNLFVASLVVIAVGNNICLLLNWLIFYYLCKKYYLTQIKNIENNLSIFKSNINNLEKMNPIIFETNKIYDFRNKIYNSWPSLKIKNIKYKNANQWLIDHYILFLKLTHFKIFNLKNSKLNFSNIDVYELYDITIKNLMVKISEHYYSIY